MKAEVKEECVISAGGLPMSASDKAQTMAQERIHLPR